MASPQIPFNLIPTQPSLTDALNLLKKDIFLNMNCHAIGTIQNFNGNTIAASAGLPAQIGQTATITINYPKTYFQLNAATGLYSPVLVTYPLLLDCPVVCLGGGTGALTMPVNTGDECLILFNDRDMDNWFQGGTGAAVATPRKHSLSDAIALVGLRSAGNVLSNYDAVRAVLRGGTGVVAVNTSNNKVLISNVGPTGSSGAYSYSTTLNTMLQSLLTALNTLVTQTAAITVTCATPGNPSTIPINAAAIGAVNTTLSSIATQIAGLLE